MTLEDACYSLKLECALRDLGFVDIGWRVVAHAGLFFVEPISWTSTPKPSDDLLGFQLQKHIMAETAKEKFKVKRSIVPSAKRALDLALSMS